MIFNDLTELIGQTPMLRLNRLAAGLNAEVLAKLAYRDVFGVVKLGFDWSINPYRGCAHACAYCFARDYHELLGFGAGTDFERRLLYKPRAPELLEQAFAKRSWEGELVVLSTVTDQVRLAVSVHR